MKRNLRHTPSNLRVKLFALLSPSLLLTTQAPNQRGSGEHFPTTRVSVIQKSLGKTRRKI